MPESYRFTWQGGTGELIEKKSRFIATVSPVKSEEEAQRFDQGFEGMEKKYQASQEEFYILSNAVIQ